MARSYCEPYSPPASPRGAVKCSAKDAHGVIQYRHEWHDLEVTIFKRDRQYEMAMIHHSIVMTSEVFGEEFLPEPVVQRNEQLRNIEQCLHPAAWRRKPLHVWLFGSSGSGKTLVARHVLHRWGKEHVVNTAYVSCWEHNTLYKVVEALVDALKILMAEQQRTSFKLDRIRRYIAGTPLVLVLDEIDEAFPRDRSAILRGLCDLGKVGLLCISRSKDTFYCLPPNVRTRLSPQVVEFPRYPVHALARILQDRADAGLTDGSWTSAVLGKIVDLSAGDARVAIQTLRSAAELAEGEKSPNIRISHIEKAWHGVNTTPKECVLSILTDDHRMLYQVVKENGGVTSGELHRLYEEKCRAIRRKPIAVRTFSNYANRLALSGLITCERARMRGKVRLFKIA